MAPGQWFAFKSVTVTGLPLLAITVGVFMGIGCNHLMFLENKQAYQKCNYETDKKITHRLSTPNCWCTKFAVGRLQ